MEEVFKTFEEKITIAIQKIKNLKDEKNSLEKKVKELEHMLQSKDQEIERLASEKTVIKNQIEKLLKELESIQA
jgi:FtsZ-binding cell division protein ZapB